MTRFAPELEALSSYRRVAITGGPKTGKTTLARLLEEKTGLPVYHTDDLLDLEWSVGSMRCAQWFDAEEYIIEGVAVPRALRKWLALNPGPLDLGVIYLREAVVPRTKSQLAMAKGVRTVWEEIRSALRARGVSIIIPTYAGQS